MPSATSHLVIPKRKPLLCLILEREGLLNERQVELAMLEWDRRRAGERYTPFGEVVLKLGFVKMRELRNSLVLQRKLAPTPNGRSSLGLLLLQNNLVRPVQLLGALKEQEATGRRLGEILMDWGLLNRRQVEIALRLQGVSMLAS